jgi:hypothetical protein
VSIVSSPLQPAAEPESAAAYRAGACNIGPYEIRRRWVSGLLGIVAAVALAALLVVVGAPPLLRVAVLFPLWGGLIGVLQARRRFCVGFALAGIVNVGTDESGRHSVIEAAARAADRAAARRLVFDALLIALPFVLLLTLLPIG